MQILLMEIAINVCSKFKYFVEIVINLHTVSFMAINIL